MLNSYILVPEIPVPSILYIWSGPANSKSNSYGAVMAYETSTKWTCYGHIYVWSLPFCRYSGRAQSGQFRQAVQQEGEVHCPNSVLLKT